MAWWSKLMALPNKPMKQSAPFVQKEVIESCAWQHT